MNLTKLDKPIGDNLCISPSALNTFIQCPSKFLMRYVFKIDVIKEPYKETEEGIAFHKWCETYYTGGQKFTSDIFLGDANHLDMEYAKNINRAQGRCLFENDIEYLEPVDTEIKIASWDNKRIGYIDRLDMMPGGNYCIVDYKPTDKRKYPADVRRQIHFYISQFNHLKDTNPEFNLLYPGGQATHGLILGYKDASHWLMSYSSRTNTAIESQIKKIRTTTQFPCKCNPLCDWCEYQGTYCYH